MNPKIERGTRKHDFRERKRDKRRRWRRRKRARQAAAKAAELNPDTQTDGLCPMEGARACPNFFPKDNCWFLPIFIGNMRVECLVDTGAELSVLADSIFSKLESSAYSNKTQEDIKFAGVGGPSASLGAADFDITIAGMPFQMNMHILSLKPVEMILGMDFLSSVDAKLDLSAGVLHISGTPISLCHYSELPTFRIKTRKREVVKAKTGRFLEAVSTFPEPKKSRKCKTDALIEPLAQLYDTTGLIVPPSLIETGRTSGYSVYLVNPTNQDIILEADTPVAFCSSVAEIATRADESFTSIYQCWLDEFSRDSSAHAQNTQSYPAYTAKPAQSTSGCPSNSETTPPAQETFHDDLPDYLQPILQNCAIKHDMLDEAVDLINEYEDVFVGPDGVLGRTTSCEGHRIDTGDTRPIRQRVRRVPPKRREIIETYLQDLLKQGCIQPSSSDWATPVVIVNKKDGSPRFCIDYRKLNEVTKKDAYPLPRIDDALDLLAFKKYFCVFDLASGYFQLPMHEDDVHKTAFITHAGLFEWLVLPMGLCNSPATFQRCMNQVFRELIPDACLVYLDDIIVFGDSFESTMNNLEAVFERLRFANLKLKPKKCRVFQTSVEYLGHIVSSDGVRADPRKVQAVKDWPTPQTIRDVRSFHGLCSYYRRFMPDFATIAAPLISLTEKDARFVWETTHQNAFDKMKALLVSAPILAYPRDTGRYIVDTDASLFGMGGVLSQIQNGEEKVIAYASKSFSKSQRRYCTTKRELLAVVYLVGNVFRPYLAPEEEFTVRTDHSSLRWLMNFKDVDGMLGRWLQVLAEFNFTIEHREGKRHLNADALSRVPARPCPKEDCPNCHPSDDILQAMLMEDLHDAVCPHAVMMGSCTEHRSGKISSSSAGLRLGTNTHSEIGCFRGTAS